MATLTPDETILGLLAIQAQHGYELLESFRSDRRLGRVWRVSTSQLYNVLKRLERLGYVDGRQIPSESGPPRVEYRLTDSGHAHLMGWLYHPAPSSSIRRVRVEFLSRLYLAHSLGLPTTGIVNAQRTACWSERERLAAESADADSGMDALTTAFVIAQLDAVLHWLTHCEEALSTSEQTGVESQQA